MNLRSLAVRSAVTVAIAALPLGSVALATPAAAATTSTATPAAAEASPPVLIRCPLTADQLLLWPGSWPKCGWPGRPPVTPDVRDTIVWE